MKKSSKIIDNVRNALKMGVTYVLYPNVHTAQDVFYNRDSVPFNLRQHT